MTEKQNPIEKPSATPVPQVVIDRPHEQAQNTVKPGIKPGSGGKPK